MQDAQQRKIIIPSATAAIVLSTAAAIVTAGRAEVSLPCA